MVLANDSLFGTSAGCELHTQRTARSHPTYEVENRSPILLPLNLKCRLFLHITPSSGASSLECDKEFANSHQTTPETRQNIRRITQSPPSNGRQLSLPVFEIPTR